MTGSPRAAVLGALLVGAAACGRKTAPPQSYAVLKTSLGRIAVRLYTDEAPKTSAHFIALATGSKAWRDPRDGKVRYDPLYTHLAFHRVIPGFMIQTGDPKGDGSGDVGVTVEDERPPGLRFDKPGLLGLANDGPGTGGSQFFITTEAAPELDGRHAVFGEVVSGLEVVRAIAAVPRDEGREANRPLKAVWLESVTVTERLP